MFQPATQPPTQPPHHPESKAFDRARTTSGPSLAGPGASRGVQGGPGGVQGVQGLVQQSLHSNFIFLNFGHDDDYLLVHLIWRPAGRIRSGWGGAGEGGRGARAGWRSIGGREPRREVSCPKLPKQIKQILIASRIPPAQVRGPAGSRRRGSRAVYGRLGSGLGSRVQGRAEGDLVEGCLWVPG